MLLYRSERFLEHDPGPAHPESPGRLRPVLASLEQRPEPGVRPVGDWAPATRAMLERVHTPAYVGRLEATAGRRVRLDPDTWTSPASWEVARLASGAAVAAVEAVVRGEDAHAFVLSRPPGHHAEADAALGFCLLNHAAVAAAHARQALGLERVLVADPDVHHGNGTQAIFYADPTVLYVSSHRLPFYPGTGWPQETGAGPGEGFTLNLPLRAGDGDEAFLRAWTEEAEPRILAFQPELILVSAGFDTWKGDPLGGLAVTEAGFRAFASRVHAWARTCCPGRAVWILEGGYDPAGIEAGVRAALRSGAAG